MSRRCDIPTHELVSNKSGGLRCRTCGLARSAQRYTKLKAEGFTTTQIRTGIGDEKEFYPWQHYDFGGH